MGKTSLRKVPFAFNLILGVIHLSEALAFGWVQRSRSGLWTPGGSKHTTNSRFELENFVQDWSKAHLKFDRSPEGPGPAPKFAAGQPSLGQAVISHFISIQQVWSAVWTCLANFLRSEAWRIDRTNRPKELACERPSGHWPAPAQTFPSSDTRQRIEMKLVQSTTVTFRTALIRCVLRIMRISVHRVLVHTPPLRSAPRC